ncbi:ferritin-like domain-containing protein [Streptomyces collinus]|uniref:ferritin-like domain-containing protein n=1 Tax=Streptomyces collinus TaxID=42684 RepID=UPI00368F21D0
MTTGSKAPSGRPWLHRKGEVIQEFGTVKQFPIGLSHDARMYSCRRLNRVPADGAEEVPAMLSRLLAAHETILTDAHDAAARTGRSGDDGTNDLLVSQVVRTGELHAWFLAEHLVDTPLVRA